MSAKDFDVDSLAVYLHLTPQQVERLASRGHLPGRKVGGQWRFSEAEIHHWMEERMGVLEESELVRVEAALARSANRAQLPLAEMLLESAIRTPLRAKTRNSVIDEMVELAETSGVIWDRVRLVEAVRSREDLQSTAMDNGVALLHPRRPLPDAAGEPVLAVGISPQGIPFGGSRRLTDVFFLICSTDERGHLRTLARLSRLIGREDFLTKLRQAASPAEIRAIVIEAEAGLSE